MEVSVYLLFVALWASSFGQDTLPCGVDNLSCPRTDPDSQSLMCLTVAELCDGSPLCPGGQDEGDNLAALNCEAGRFVCSPEQSVTLDKLCDGTADCSNGNDETTAICENKCRSPYRGGCAELNRECTASGLDVSCGACLSGYVEVAGTCVQGLTIGLQHSLYSVDEMDGSLEVCAEVLEGSILANETVFVNYITASSDAEAPDDFIAQTGTFQMTSSAMIQCISIPVISDGVDESDQECFTVSISEASGVVNLTISPDLATVCITDADVAPITIGLQHTTYSVGEIDGTQAVCIEVISGDTAGRDIVINFSTTNGVATSPSDYTAQSGSVTITDDAQFQCIPITIVYSSSREQDVECFTFSISAADTVTGLTVDPAQAFVCIIDRNAIPVQIGIQRSLYYVNEGRRTVYICVGILSGRTAGRSFYVQFRTVDGDAVAPSDYTSRTGNFYIDDGTSSRCYSISIVSDSVDEEEECFIVSISASSSRGLTLNPRMATICIKDDDPTPVRIGLQQTMYSVYETDGYQVVCAEIQSGDIAERTVEISYSTTNGTAIAPDDYTTLNGTFQLKDNVLLQCVPIMITLDNADEPEEECFTYSIASPSTVAGLTLYPTEAMICISDREEVAVPQPRLHLQQSFYSVSEADGSVEVCAEVTTQQFEGSIQVNYSTAGGSAQVSEDFASQSGVLSFTNDTLLQCASIVIVNDNSSETHQECFTLSLLGARNIVENPNIATVCINDDDAHPVTIGLQQTSYTVDEVDGTVAVCMEVISGEVDGRDIVINYATSSGTAIAPTDYTSLSGFVTITDDVVFQCISVSIQYNSRTEPDVECFTFRISAANTISGLSVYPAQASVCITDRDAIPIQIGIQRSLYYVNEDRRTVYICAGILSGRTAGRSFYVQFRTVDGDAVAPSDYTSTTGNFYINDGTSSRCYSISIVSDNVDEKEECFIVSISASSSRGLTLNPRIATVCIKDDDPTPVRIGLKQTMYSVYETDGYQVVCAEIQSGDIAERTVEISYSTTSGTAIAPDDYTILNGTFQLKDNVLLQCVPIMITLDNVDEPEEECFIYSIASPSTVAGLTLYPTEAMICITDREEVVVPQPRLHLQQSFYSVSEADGSVEVCAEVTTQQFEGSIQVNYSTAGGSAEVSEDFASQSGVLSFTNDTLLQCASIVIVNDNSSETHQECFTLSLLGARDIVENPNIATVCINDDDAHPVTIGLQQTSYRVDEVDGTVAVCMEVISGEVDGRDIVINYATSSGTAVAPTDYINLSGFVTITDEVVFQCISVSIIQLGYDRITEPDVECFTFRISAANAISGLSVYPAEASVCITDERAIPIQIGIQRSLYYVNENGRTVYVCTGILSGRTAGRSFYVQFRTVDGDAVAPSDYTSTTGNFYINDGTSSQCYSISIVSDSVDEEEECFIVSISASSSRGLTLNPQMATVCIRDDDATAVRIGLQQSLYTVHESSEHQVVCAEVLSGSTAGREIEITYMTTCTQPGCTTQNGSIQITDTTPIQCIPISITSDTSSEQEECFTFNMSPATPTSGLILNPSQASICVLPTEAIQVSIGLLQSFYSVEEAVSSLEVCTEVTSGSLAGRSFLFNYTTIDGTALAPDDYNSTIGAFSISDSATVQCVDIPIISDNDDELDHECFTFSLSTSDLHSLTVNVPLATICIFDDDDYVSLPLYNIGTITVYTGTEVTVGLQQTVYSVRESDCVQLVCTEVKSGRVAGRTITINYETADGMARAPGDYTDQTGSFDITDSASVQCIPITIVSDGINEPDQDCFTYSITSVSSISGLTLSPHMATVCISDGEITPMVIGLQHTFYSVTEGQGSVDICTAVTSGDISGGNVDISYSTTSGLAEAPVDYIAQSGTFQLSQFTAHQCITIPIISDTVDELDLECFIFSISSALSNTQLNIRPSIATICISDGPRVYLSLQPPVVAEGQTAQACLTLTNLQRLSGAANVTLHTHDSDPSTATVGTDYLSASQEFTLDLAMLETQVCIPILTLEDGLVEQTESVLIVASSGGGVVVSGSPASLEIHNREFGFYQFVEQTYSIRENASSLQVSIELAPSSGTLLSDLTVLVSAISSSATAISDFTPVVSVPLMFPAGSEAGTTQNFTVAIVNDVIVEGNEVFSLTAVDSSLNVQPVEGRDSVTVAIIDDDAEVNVGFQHLHYTVEEQTSNVDVCLQVFGSETLSQTSLVRVQTEDGSAQATSDYAPVNSVIVFPAGSSGGDEQCINVTILYDEIMEGTETFTLRVSSVELDSLIVIDPTHHEATVSIADDEMVNFRVVAPSNVTEESGSVVACIEQMNNQLSEDVYVEIKTVQIGSTAAAVSDYDPLVATLTFAAGSTGPNSLCDNIRIVDDNLVEGDEVIVISASFTNSFHGISLLNDRAFIAINDNDYAVYEWENPEYKSVEDSDTLTVQLCLSEESGTLISQVQVSVTSVPISATEDVDFSSISGTLLFESGSESGECLPVTITIIKDDLLESDETFQLSASVSTSHALFSPGGEVTTVVIQDDDGCQRVGESDASTSDCTETAGATQVGGGVVAGFVGGVLVTLVLAVITFILIAIGWRHRKRSGQASIREREPQGIGGAESRGKDYEMSYTPLPEKDGSSQ